MLRTYLKTVFGVLLSMSLFFTGYISAADDTLKIGVSIRMISDTGFKIGKMIEDEFAGINQFGGINGRKVELVFLNDECKSEKGVANANRLVHQDKVLLLIGSSCSSVTLPMVDITAKAGVPQITPHSTNPQITQKMSEWIFRVPVSGRFYKAVQAEYVIQKVGNKLAYIWGPDAAGQKLTEDTIAYIKEKYDVDPVYTAQVQEKEVDYRSVLLKAKAASPDAVFLSGLEDDVARMLIQSYEVGIPKSVKRVAPSVASKQEVPLIAGDAAIGVFYAAAFSHTDQRDLVQWFTERVQRKYETSPDHDFSQAWDMVRILEIALKRADIKNSPDTLAEDRAAIRDALASIRNYQGLAAGPISFCKEPTPQCRDGNRTPVLIEYVKGGKDFETRILDTLTFDADFGL